MYSQKEHILQSKQWEDFKQQRGQSAHRIEDQLLLIKDTPTPFSSFGYMPQVDLEKVNWEELIKMGKKLGLSHIQIDPNNLATEYNPLNIKIQGAKIELAKAIQYRHTIVFPLGQTAEQLMADMKSKHRYNIRLAKKKGVKVRITQDEKDFEIFLRLFFETVDRQGYYGRTPDYYRQLWQILKPADKCRVAIAEFEGEPLVAWLLLNHEDTIYYYYGGSSTLHRNLMAAYLVVWEVIAWSQSRGLSFFDLGGLLSSNPDDPSYGIYRFKTGFRPEQVDFADAISVVLNQPAYLSFQLANKLRWAFLKLRRKIS